jgi:hypothetical protein
MKFFQMRIFIYLASFFFSINLHASNDHSQEASLDNHISNLVPIKVLICGVCKNVEGALKNTIRNIELLTLTVAQLNDFI